MLEQMFARCPAQGRRREVLVALTKKAISERLTPRQQTAVRLCFGEGRTVRAAAAEMGCSAATVSRECNAARKILLDALEYAVLILSFDDLEDI